MEYLSKSYRLDEEVIDELKRLARHYGSVNKGLRRVLFDGKVASGPNYGQSEMIVSNREPEQPGELAARELLVELEGEE